MFPSWPFHSGTNIHGALLGCPLWGSYRVPLHAVPHKGAIFRVSPQGSFLHRVSFTGSSPVVLQGSPPPSPLYEVNSSAPLQLIHPGGPLWGPLLTVLFLVPYGVFSTEFLLRLIPKRSHLVCPLQVVRQGVPYIRIPPGGSVQGSPPLVPAVSPGIPSRMSPKTVPSRFSHSESLTGVLQGSAWDPFQGFSPGGPLQEVPSKGSPTWGSPYFVESRIYHPAVSYTESPAGSLHQWIPSRCPLHGVTYWWSPKRLPLQVSSLRGSLKWISSSGSATVSPAEAPPNGPHQFVQSRVPRGGNQHGLHRVLPRVISCMVSALGVLRGIHSRG